MRTAAWRGPAGHHEQVREMPLVSVCLAHRATELGLCSAPAQSGWKARRCHEPSSASVQGLGTELLSTWLDASRH